MATKRVVPTLAGIGALALALVGGSACDDAAARQAELRQGGDAVRAAHAAATAKDALTLTVTAEGNRARYRIRERLVGKDFPNDAVGETAGVRGAIAFDGAGRIDVGASSILVDLTRLKSDSDRRDGYVARRLLDTEEYPVARLVPTEVRGLELPLPASGRDTLEVVGQLTVRDATRPTVWTVVADYADGAVTGTAVTHFTFDDFGLAQPRVPVLLSVSDTIALEYDFRLEAR